MARKEEPKIEPQTELEVKIMEAFQVYDHSGKQAVDPREIGNILRSLGCCPTEAEVQEVTRATENDDPERLNDSVLLSCFLPYMVTAMTAHRFYPASADELLAAFRYFDKEGRGFLTKNHFVQLMTEEGEPFCEEELVDTLNIALDPVTDTITYEYYVNQLLVSPLDVYNIADALEAERLAILEANAPKKRTASQMLKLAEGIPTA